MQLIILKAKCIAGSDSVLSCSSMILRVNLIKLNECKIDLCERRKLEKQRDSYLQSVTS